MHAARAQEIIEPFIAKDATPGRRAAMARALSQANPLLAERLHKIFTSGANIGFGGPRVRVLAANHPSSFEFAEQVTASLHKEVQMGRMRGPFSEPPFRNFRVNPMGAVPKEASPAPGELLRVRVINDCSFPRVGKVASVNEGIDKDEFGFVLLRFDEFVEWAGNCGRGACMWKEDMSDAYRLVPVRKEDHELLGRMWDYWDGERKPMYFYDVVLPFGLRSSRGLYNVLADGVQELFKMLKPQASMGHYMDDAAGVAKPCSCTDGSRHVCAGGMEHAAYRLVCSTYGVPLNEKGGLFMTRMTFLGIAIDSEAQTLTLPPEKLKKIRNAVKSWRESPRGTVRQLASLAGLLQHAARVVRWGRSFVRALIDDIAARDYNAFIHLSQSAKRDLKWWDSGLNRDDFIGVSFFLEQDWTAAADLGVHTDGAGASGFGGICGPSWFAQAWKPCHCIRKETGISIAWQELFAIVVAAALWGSEWRGKKVVFWCDNMSMVQALRKGTSPKRRIMALIRALLRLAWEYNFEFSAKHVSGVKNVLADPLSRLQLDIFRSRAASMGLLIKEQPEQVPGWLLRL
jgi:hypothetical protein